MPDDEMQVESYGPFSFDPANGPPDIGAMLSRALGGRGGGGASENMPLDKILPLLQEGYDRYIRCYGVQHNDPVGPFKPGDWVMPFEFSAVKGHGHPAIVLETRWQDPSVGDGFLDSNGRSSNSYGSRQNIRILSENHGKIVAHWVEPSDFEFFEPPTE